MYILNHLNTMSQPSEEQYTATSTASDSATDSASDSATDTNMPTFSKKERDNYERQKEKAKFKTPEEEYAWCVTQFKKCSKCEMNKALNEFDGNTSGSDAFDKYGYRLRRPECHVCKNQANKGKNDATRLAKELGIPYKAPDGTICAICKEEPKKGYTLVFDHCHEKNIFRGYCCNSCNRSMGVLGDNVEGLLKTINYLLKSNPCKILQQEDGTLSIM
jgi:hypothetical protein